MPLCWWRRTEPYPRCVCYRLAACMSVLFSQRCKDRILVLWLFQIQVKPLLPPVKSKDSGKICVVIDLDETLVHSSFKVGKFVLLITSSYAKMLHPDIVCKSFYFNASVLKSAFVVPTAGEQCRFHHSCGNRRNSSPGNRGFFILCCLLSPLPPRRRCARV